MSTLSVTDILRHLPHRYPFLLVDRVLEIKPPEFIVAQKNVTINEPFFQGHFPDHPVMPGVLIIEALAQAAAILVFLSAGKSPADGTVVYLLGIDDARFKSPVVPGDVLTLHARFDRQIRGIWRCVAEAKVGDKTVAEAKMMCTLRSA